MTRPTCGLAVSTHESSRIDGPHGAGWHQSQALTLANNLRLLKLPPYSPELNPVEHLWDDLREKSFHNRIFDSIDALEIRLESPLWAMELDHPRVRSIVAWPWIINSLTN